MSHHFLDDAFHIFHLLHFVKQYRLILVAANNWNNFLEGLILYIWFPGQFVQTKRQSATNSMLALKIFWKNNSWNHSKYLTIIYKNNTVICYKYLLIAHYIIDLMFFFLFSDRYVFVIEFKSYQHLSLLKFCVLFSFITLFLSLWRIIVLRYRINWCFCYFNVTNIEFFADSCKIILRIYFHCNMLFLK